jgi:nucleotide-binding universal stress UspA family protein
MPSTTLPASTVAKTVNAHTAAIVCGTDFSENAVQAVDAAGALAKCAGAPVVLVHAVDHATHEALPGDLRESLCVFGRARLHEEIERLHGGGAEVIEHFGAGKPHAILLEAAAAHHAQLIVLSSRGHPRFERIVLGSVAERTAEASPVPTLVVREAAPFIRWQSGRRKLRVFVGADFSDASEAALRWVGALRECGECEIAVAYIEPMLAEPVALEAFPSPAVSEMLERTKQLQARCFRQRVRELLAGTRVRIMLEAGWGRSDAHLIELAREEQADLIVVGTHQRHGLSRIGHPSVSRGVLHYAPMSVACIPAAPTVAKRE